jgi:hypothetical protein
MMFDPHGQRAYVAADLGMVESALRAVSPLIMEAEQRRFCRYRL